MVNRPQMRGFGESCLESVQDFALGWQALLQAFMLECPHPHLAGVAAVVRGSWPPGNPPIHGPASFPKDPGLRMVDVRRC